MANGLFQGPALPGQTSKDIETFRQTGQTTFSGPGGFQGAIAAMQARGMDPFSRSSTITSGVGGGGGGGGGGAPALTTPESLMQETLDFSEVDRIIAPALESLGRGEQTLRDIAASSEQRAQRESEGILGGLSSALEEALGQIGQKRITTQQTGERGLASGRRQASELQRGIQSRFGGTTGTGRFASEVIGAQSLQNLAATRQQTANALKDIDLAETALRRDVSDKINQEKIRLQNSKALIREQLMQGLADINRQRGELESNKAQLRFNLLQDFRERQRQLEDEARAQQAKIAAAARARANEIQKVKVQATGLLEGLGEFQIDTTVPLTGIEGLLQQLQGQGIDLSSSRRPGEEKSVGGIPPSLEALVGPIQLRPTQ